MGRVVERVVDSVTIRSDKVAVSWGNMKGCGCSGGKACFEGGGIVGDGRRAGEDRRRVCVGRDNAGGGIVDRGTTGEGGIVEGKVARTNSRSGRFINCS